jgi:nucleoid-associated protein YgaU
MTETAIGPTLQKATLQLLWPTTVGGAASGRTLPKVTFQFNPKEYSVQKGASWASTPATGAPETADPQFKGAEPRSMTVEVFLDATAKGTASSSKKSTPEMRSIASPYQGAAGASQLLADIEILFSCCRPLQETLNLKVQSPPFVLFSWGTVTLHAFVKQVSVKYTLFKADGTPIRATATLTLQEIPKEMAKQNPTSGGLSPLRSRTVVAGDSLASIAFAEYGDPRLWRALAEINRIDDPMRLPTGTRLMVPTYDSAAVYA